MNSGKIPCAFLGTCAADFHLLKITDCADRFDLNARRASCMLIGESLLIDCGMHAIDSMRIAKADISKITDIFLTHTHADHFNRENVEKIAENKKFPVRLWCRQDAIIPPIDNVETVNMKEGEYYSVCEGINAMSVYANHDEDSFPQHILFNVNGKKLLYATDGAWLLSRACKHLKNKLIDYYIIDATCGDYVGDYRFAAHNSIPMIRLMLPSLKANGIIGDETKIILTHIAPSLHKPHEQICRVTKADGMTVAYDGMTFEL
ncbi:MAG: MBL fold metallo-hydrolase [Clostridia bacterium]|nr:MBL fold metallo-hydrolase [Clostridia bacterium]